MCLTHKISHSQGLSNVLIVEYINKRGAGKAAVFFFAANTTDEGIGFLHDEKGEAGLPGIETYPGDGKDTMVFGNFKITCLDKVEGMGMGQ